MNIDISRFHRILKRDFIYTVCVCVCVCVIRFTQKHDPKSHPSPPTCFTLTLTHPTWETRPARGTDNIRVDLAPVPFFRNEEE